MPDDPIPPKPPGWKEGDKEQESNKPAEKGDEQEEKKSA
jgi:hypothetical protein